MSHATKDRLVLLFVVMVSVAVLWLAGVGLRLVYNSLITLAK